MSNIVYIFNLDDSLIYLNCRDFMLHFVCACGAFMKVLCIYVVSVLQLAWRC